MLIHGLSPAQPPTGAAAPRRWTPLRTLSARHRERVAVHLLALDDTDRIRRFGHLASDERIRNYAEQLDFDRDEVIGAFDSRLKLIALAHVAFDAERSSAEFGVSVSAEARGRGLGGQLFDHAVTHARNRGAHTMVIHMARENAAMLAIVRRAGAAMRFEGSEALAELPLPADTLGSQIRELLAHQAANLDYRLKLQVLRLDALWSGRP